ncbi:MAG TPA: FAD-containing monooxygenase EthA, partial [Acidimicrobiales bacterium]|nr:FAD-containing monooxygenase EthA [Acidimicrobiales bacterium]
ELVCRLLNHMDERGATMVAPALRDDELDMALGPWVDPENFNPGYLTRSLHLMPKQGDHDPWRLLHDYGVEKDLIPNADLEDGTLQFK